MSRIPSSVRCTPFHAAVALSFLTLLAFAWIRGGVSSTSYDTVDSMGRTMGFNDVFFTEHYGILMGNGSPGAALRELGVHGWILIAAHITVLIFVKGGRFRGLRIFHWFQPLLFFWGVPALYAMPMEVADLVWLHTNTRESFVDLPWVSIMSQGAWLWACIFMLWKLRRPRRAATAGAACASCRAVV